LREVISRLELMEQTRITVEINPLFVRPNEIAQLAGNGRHLEECIGSIQWRPLDETLRWMLDADE
jgi:GDP-6-deoxy-D-talose 4-dehydrogenase